jgi:hypothetical protein
MKLNNETGTLMGVFKLIKCPLNCFVGLLFALDQNKSYPFCSGSSIRRCVVAVLSTKVFCLYAANKLCLFWTENMAL